MNGIKEKRGEVEVNWLQKIFDFGTYKRLTSNPPGHIGIRYMHRSSQSKRRKMERRGQRKR